MQDHRKQYVSAFFNAALIVQNRIDEIAGDKEVDSQIAIRGKMEDFFFFNTMSNLKAILSQYKQTEKTIGTSSSASSSPVSANTQKDITQLCHRGTK